LHNTLTGNVQIQRVVKSLTKNLVYNVQFGNVKIKRKGGVQFLNRQRSTEEQRFLSKLDLKGKTVYDIGAYLGIITTFFAKSVGSSGRVIAFEPNPNNFLEVKKSVELNDLHNVDILNMGVADVAGNIMMAVRNNDSGTSSMDPAIQAQILAEKNSITLTVEIDTLDHCITDKHLSPPHFIKMDIEGMEYKALKGLDRTLRQHAPDMYIEIHGADKDSKIANIRRIVDLFQGSNYQIYHVESKTNITPKNAEAGMEGHIFCQKKTKG
jgi:FkbM family methyltransferase